MSQDRNADGKHQPPDVDISRRTRSYAWLWIVVIVLVAAALYYTRNQPESPYRWGFLVIVAALAGLAILLAWLYFRFSWRWLSMAQRASMELHRGNTAKAERAYQKALAYTEKLPAGDPRKASMYVELANYLNDCCRRGESRAMLDQALAMLEKHSDKDPLNYFIALNNHAVYLMAEHEYAEAQRVLERALDLSPTMKKKDIQSPEMDILLNINVVFLLIKLGKPADAEPYMDEAVRLFDALGHGSQKAMRDSVLSHRALWYCALGQYDDAEDDIEQAGGFGHGNLKWAQAKVHLARGKFAEAETILRDTVAQWQKLGSSHRPENLEVTLDLSESLFHQGKHDEAFAALQEARAIAADFKLPPDEPWRTALAIWLERAKSLGRLELASELERELAQMATVGSHAITILEKLRITKVPNEPEA